MEDIYLDKTLDPENVLKTLSEIFSELTVFHYDFNNATPDKLDLGNPTHIFFNTKINVDANEFGFTVSVYRTPDNDYQERQLYIAKIFADKYKTRVIVPFTKPDEQDYPYYNIMFDNGKIFLADDCEVDYVNNTGGVKILGEYVLPIARFDSKAVLSQ